MSTRASVLISGNYVDSYLYGGLLLVWDDKGRLGITTTEAVASAAAEKRSTPTGLARAAFVDNKLLADPRVTARLAKSGLSEARNGDGVIVHLEMDDLNPRYFAVAPDVDVLDLMATYSRLFISTDDSLLSVPFGPQEVGDVRFRMKHRCLSTTPRWGGVSASCAEYGLWELFNELEVEGGERARAQQIETGISVRHSWLGTSLLSFNEDNEFDILKASVPTRKGQPRIVETFQRIEEFADPSEFDWLVTGRNDPLSRDEPEFVTSFTSLLVSASKGRVQATRVSTWEGYPQPLGESELVAEVPGRVLSIADTDGGFVVETDEELRYVAAQGSAQLIGRETISLRSYQRSRRHRRTISATVDGGLLISALLGEHLLPVDERRLYP